MLTVSPVAPRKPLIRSASTGSHLPKRLIHNPYDLGIPTMPHIRPQWAFQLGQTSTSRYRLPMDDSFMLRAAADLQAETHRRCGQVAARCRQPLDIGFITAVQYWGVPKPRGCSMDDSLVHTVHQTSSGRCQVQGVKAHLWSAGCNQMDVRHASFTIASPPSAWAQIASYCDDEALLAVGSAFLTRDPTRRVCSKEDFLIFLSSTRSFAQRRRCLEMVDRLVENTDSPTEVTLFELLRQHGVGPLTANLRVDGQGEHWFIDIAIREIRVAFEYQGAYHVSVGQMRRDAHKLNELQRMHWAVIQVTADDLRTEVSRQILLDTINEIVEFQRHLASLMGWLT